jgi:hypothetical protein
MRCVEIAAMAWGVDRSGLVDSAVHTLFIEANKRGLTVPAPHAPRTAEQKAAAVRDAIDQYASPPKALDEPELDQPPPWAFG